MLLFTRSCRSLNRTKRNTLLKRYHISMFSLITKIFLVLMIYFFNIFVVWWDFLTGNVGVVLRVCVWVVSATNLRKYVISCVLHYHGTFTFLCMDFASTNLSRWISWYSRGCEFNFCILHWILILWKVRFIRNSCNDQKHMNSVAENTTTSW